MGRRGFGIPFKIIGRTFFEFFFENSGQSFSAFPQSSHSSFTAPFIFGIWKGTLFYSETITAILCRQTTYPLLVCFITLDLFFFLIDEALLLDRGGSGCIVKILFFELANQGLLVVWWAGTALWLRLGGLRHPAEWAQIQFCQHCFIGAWKCSENHSKN